jgi:ferredoxin
VSERLRVDPLLCDAYGYCAELLPEVITLDEWGYPVIDPGALPEAVLADARRAASACPMLALRLERRKRRLAVAPEA